MPVADAAFVLHRSSFSLHNSHSLFSMSERGRGRSKTCAKRQYSTSADRYQISPQRYANLHAMTSSTCSWATPAMLSTGCKAQVRRLKTSSISISPKLPASAAIHCPGQWHHGDGQFLSSPTPRWSASRTEGTRGGPGERCKCCVVGVSMRCRERTRTSGLRKHRPE